MEWSQLALKIMFTGISFIILAGLCLFLVVRIQRALAVNNKREHVVKITNQANFTSIFILTVASVEKILSFKLLLNDVPLIPAPQVEISQPNYANPNPVAAGPAAGQKAGGQPGSAMSGAAKSGQAIAAKAGLVATMLGTLGALLPGSMGSNLRAQSQALREAQSNTLSAVQAPVNAQRKVEALQHESGKLVSAKPGAAAASGKPSIHSQPVAQSTPLAAARPSAAAVPKATPGVYVVQTQPLAPGAGLSLVLRIGSPGRPEGSFAYKLSSQQQPLETFAGEAQPVIRQGLVHFPHIEIWRYWLAPAINLLVIAGLTLPFIFIFRLIWF